MPEKVANHTDTASSRSPLAEFVMASLNMSWQLAVVVLVPLIGGYEIDKHCSTFPVFLILGILVAMGGSAAVVHHQLVQFGPPPKSKGTQ